MLFDGAGRFGVGASTAAGRATSSHATVHRARAPAASWRRPVFLPPERRHSARHHRDMQRPSAPSSDDVDEEDLLSSTLTQSVAGLIIGECSWFQKRPIVWLN